MRKIIFLSTLSLFFVSCLSVKAPNVYTGMTIDQFRKVAKHEELVQMSGGYTVFRVQYGMSGQETRFYYFRNGRLVEMNEGERKVDARIQIDKN